jgi:hypothetical protein
MTFTKSTLRRPSQATIPVFACTHCCHETLTTAWRAAQAQAFLCLQQPVAVPSTRVDLVPRISYKMSADSLHMRVHSSTEPQEQHSDSTASKGSQRCISIHADVDDAAFGVPESLQGQAHASGPLSIQSTSMLASEGSCGVVYDAVMELHMREGEGSRCWLRRRTAFCTCPLLPAVWLIHRS